MFMPSSMTWMWPSPSLSGKPTSAADRVKLETSTRTGISVLMTASPEDFLKLTQTPGCCRQNQLCKDRKYPPPVSHLAWTRGARHHDSRRPNDDLRCRLSYRSG